jgi:hypothetical protein
LIVASLRFGAYTLLCFLITNYACWMFLMVSSVHDMGCEEKSTEMKLELLEVSAILCCAISLLTRSCINQKLESNPAIVPATTHAENFMEPKSDEVRWLVHVRNPSDVHTDSAIG